MVQKLMHKHYVDTMEVPVLLQAKKKRQINIVRAYRQQQNHLQINTQDINPPDTMIK